MRTNEAVTNKSELLKLMVSRIEKHYSSDVDILVCYGSYITGKYTSISDIDFCFIPKNDRAFRLCSQFIVDGIGYDLWPISWNRIESIVALDESFASIMMDGVVLYADSQQSLDFFEEKKTLLTKKMNSSEQTSQKSALVIARLKARYFDSLEKSDKQLSVEIVDFFEDLLFALSLMNGKMIHKGSKDLETEIGRFDKVPPRLLQDYQKVISCNDQTVILQTMRRLISDAELIWKKCFSSEGEIVEIASLSGFYEELKSAYNKLLYACKANDYDGAYYAAYLIDRETQGMLASIPAFRDYPTLTMTLKNSGFSSTIEECLRHEKLLVGVLKEGQVKVKTFGNFAEYSASLEELTP